MIAYTRLSQDELYFEKLQANIELAQTIENACKEKDRDKKEVIFDRVLQLSWCVAELQGLMNPSMKITIPTEKYLRKLCDFPKLNFTNTNDKTVGKIK